jgi:hypothetical protein
LVLLRILRIVADIGIVPVSPEIAVVWEGVMLVVAAGALGSLPALATTLRQRPADALRSG